MTVFVKKPLFLAVLSVVLAVVWTGCDLNGTDPVDDRQSFFELQVSGDVNEEIGGFHSLFATLPDTEIDENLVLLELVTQDQRGMRLFGRFNDVPEEGTYDIVLEDEEADNPFAELEEEELLGFFITVTAEGEELAYNTISGFLDIHSSEEEWLEGTFEYAARLNVDDEEGEEEAPEIVVQGEFRAQRGQVQ